MAQASGFFSAGEGKTIRIGSIRSDLHEPGFEPQGDYSICVSNSPPESGLAFHRHPYDEWHVSESRVSTSAKSGTRFTVLAQVRPCLRPEARSMGSKILVLASGDRWALPSPAGVFEAMITEVVGAQVDSGNPSRAGSPGFREITAKYGIEFV